MYAPAVRLGISKDAGEPTALIALTLFIAACESPPPRYATNEEVPIAPAPSPVPTVTSLAQPTTDANAEEAHPRVDPPPQSISLHLAVGETRTFPVTSVPKL